MNGSRFSLLFSKTYLGNIFLSVKVATVSNRKNNEW